MSAPTQNKNGMDFVTVVSVGSEEAPLAKDEEVEESQLESEQCNAGYVTVLKIGQPSPPQEIIEEVLVYRLPGERLGFGLKFEGGTKAAEFVKRLFIQSCAPDSPASMVHCSWGKLTEGDEVLNIDSLPVTSMTRIDCVRCLKDSNVVIKLLVKHLVNDSEDSSGSTDASARITEDLPHVIGAEKKRIPPPPPPVPPRKIPRKMLKESANVVANANLPTDVDETIVNGHRNPRFHSPRSSGKFAHSRQSPEVSRHGQRDRRPSDGSIGPPDAEVYLDLFSQESGCSLSESDDTGSSISTIIDRFGSFPTTTNSSLAGSLPSTPTSIQRKLDISNLLSPFDKSDLDELSSDNYLFTKLTALENEIDKVDGHLKNDEVSVKLAKDEVANEEATPLQPPTSFQDAPLSYGNESVGLADANEVSLLDTNMKYVETADENGNCLKEININKVNKGELSVKNKSEIKKRPPPPPPPCEKQKLENKDANELEVHSATDLPRLVDFVPKCSKTRHQIVESINVFLENEIRHSELLFSDEKEKIDKENEFDSDSVPEMYNPELYNLSWSLSPQLATIGEDDEEGCQESYFQKSPNAAPIVVIENTDTEGCETENSQTPNRSNTPDDNETELLEPEICQDINMETSLLLNSSNDACEAVEGPPSSSRQPPDGDEFPDYHETPITPKLLKIEDHSKLQLPWTYNGLWKNSSSVLFRDQQSSCSVRDKIAIFSSASKSNDLPSLKKICKSTDDIFSSLEKERLGKDKTSSVSSNKVRRSASTLCKSEITFNGNEKKSNIFKELHENSSSLDLPIDTPQPRLHTRSQSLMDINSVNQISKKDRWNLLAEQRQRNLSKLKGLIIPEKVIEVDVPNVVDLPEIKSNDVSSTSLSTTLPATASESPIISCQRNLNVPSLTTPPWSNTNNVPKYSPAFKRKSLQLHHEILPRNDVYTIESRKTTLNGVYEPEIVSAKSNQNPYADKAVIQTDAYENHDSKISGALCSMDAPKSLESITSPTRSDCSFEYVTSPDAKSGRQEGSQKICHLETRMGLYALNKGKEDVGKFEDESDNDSAVSSSQSSYISRTSPPTSPSHLHSNFTSRACGINESDSLAPLKCHSTGFQPHSQSGDNQNHRLLKPQSVEAINRKNILASAKCRSGRDLKIGSPLIQRKFEDESNNAQHNNIELEHNGRTPVYENVDIPPNQLNEAVVNSKIDLSNGWSRKEKPIEEREVEKVETVKTVSTDVNANTKITPKISKIAEKSSKDGAPFELSSHERKIPIPKSLTKEVRATSVTDLRKSFEKLSPVQTTPPLPNGNSNKNNSPSAIKNNQLRKYPSSTQVSAKQDKELVSQTIQQLREQGYSDVEIIVLRPEIPGGSVGITLAGGSDYENKEITVYKIREDSSAHRDGRLQKGDKIVAINGKSVKGLTHKQLVALLKEPLPEVTLAVNKQEKTSPDISLRNSASSASVSSTKQKDKTSTSGKRKVFAVPLEKDAAGLGLSLEGGQDSLLGSVPLQIKKIFKGGAAEKCGNLFQGDELLLVNETDVTSMSRFEVWSILKKLPEGVTISLTIRR